MLLVPEIETVVILVPRTGSGSLYRALLEKYPKAINLYRHMEADGVPIGYDRWRKVGVVRHPLDRLWSMYKFCQEFGLRGPGKYPAYGARLRESVDRPFEDWLFNNEIIFCGPGNVDEPGVFYPQFHVNHQVPENRKSQHTTLRPDLGTEIFPFYAKHDLASDLGVSLGHENRTEQSCPPPLTREAIAHIMAFFPWDLEQFQGQALTYTGEL